ncbi:MAG: ABC transporter ATP-binding protein [Candidatus Thermoplasmatota archaeon]|nr:ABC transporter ATP-binding protein [Candidatus Thermoplasmatota archaeon]
MTAPIIILDNVDLKFPKLKGILSAIKDKLTGKTTSFTALKNVNLEINSGEVFGLIGKNGSGKSTILRVISGIYPPDEGQCKVSGSISLLAGLGTGFSGHQTGVENALLYGSILGHNEHEMREMLPEIIQFSELGDFIDEPIRTYSAGMKARLGLAVATAIKPDILLIDEVLGVGDPQFREKSKSRILSLVEKTGTVVIVSHSFALMKDICDRIGVVNQGKIVMVGTPDEAITAYYALDEGDSDE